MKILVPIARIVDPTLRVAIADDGRTLATHARQMVMNPFDEVALTMAVSLKAAGKADEVIAVGIGGESYQETLRSALAMQADRAVLVMAESATVSTVVAALAALVGKEGAGLVLCGKQSADDDACCVGQMLAGRLDCPQAISAVQLSLEAGCVVARCDHGRQLADFTLPLPAVVGVDLLLCPPKFPTLMQILKAKKQPIERVPLADLGVDPGPDALVEARQLTVSKRACVYLDSVAELAEIIGQRAG